MEDGSFWVGVFIGVGIVVLIFGLLCVGCGWFKLLPGRGSRRRSMSGPARLRSTSLSMHWTASPLGQPFKRRTLSSGKLPSGNTLSSPARAVFNRERGASVTRRSHQPLRRASAAVEVRDKEGHTLDTGKKSRVLPGSPIEELRAPHALEERSRILAAHASKLRSAQRQAHSASRASITSVTRKVAAPQRRQRSEAPEPPEASAGGRPTTEARAAARQRGSIFD